MAIALHDMEFKRLPQITRSLRDLREILCRPRQLARLHKCDLPGVFAQVEASN
jgi:hypothetical protein